MPNTAKKLDPSFAEIAREVRGRIKLGDPKYASVYVSRIINAFCRTLKEPDIEVRVSFDSVTEFSEACSMVGDLIVRFKAAMLVDWDKSSDDKDSIEFLNGSALTLIGPKGELYLKGARSG